MARLDVLLVNARQVNEAAIELGPADLLASIDI